MVSERLAYWTGEERIRGGSLYLVGGTVRDLLAGRAPKDLDLVCRGAKDVAAAIAMRREAALVPMEKRADEPSYRVVDRHQPERFLDITEMRGGDIVADLSQRDFTINAVAVEIRDDGAFGEVIDPLNGAGDIQLKTIRMTGSRALRSDPLRILRAVRLSASLDFAIEAQTMTEMRRNRELLAHVSSERIVVELMRILHTSESARFFRMMDHEGILGVIFPEIMPMKGCEQNGYHHRDVWEHSLLAMEKTEHILNRPEEYGVTVGSQGEAAAVAGRGALLKMSALFHDVGKPLTRRINPESGRITFHGHDKEGATIMAGIADRLKMSAGQKEYLVLIIAEHLHPLMLASQKATPGAMVRWFRKMKDRAVDAFILSMADVMSSQGPASGESYRRNYLSWAGNWIRAYYGGIKQKIDRPPLIRGDDLITMGMRPGPEIGRILARVRDARDAGEISSREEALKLAMQAADWPSRETQ